MHIILKNRIFNGLIGVSLILSLLCIPFFHNVIYASTLQQEDLTKACSDGEAKAMENVNKSDWFIIGCLLGLVGIIVASASQNNPPAEALVGKSPEYVAKFSECYKKKAKSIKSSGATSGCLVGVALSLLVDLVILGGSSSQ